MYSYLPDILLILISSLSCLYCILLSRRLNKLQNLDDGLGASIVSLTQAITNTSDAAKYAREATEESVGVLRTLLREAQDTLPLVDAKIESLRHSRTAAKATHNELEKALSLKLKPELKNAHDASKALKQIVQLVTQFQQRINIAKPVEQNQTSTQDNAA